MKKQKQYLNSLSVKTGEYQIYICSPWIRLDDHQLKRIQAAVFKASGNYQALQIIVITLPLDRYRDEKAISTLIEFKKMGAEIFTHRKLHAKLYISEPGPSGGVHYAIFGSENLTGRQNIELGIKIENDNEILRKLTAFFLSIQEEAEIVREVTK